MTATSTPSQATNAMAAGARQGGAKILRHNPVEAIERAASGEWLLHCKQGTIRADIIVNAAGTWCREIGAMMGLDLPVVPMLHQYLVTDRIEAVAALERPLPMIRDPEESWYLRQERDGLICGPYEAAGHPWAVEGVPPDFGMELLPPELERMEAILELAMARVPALAEGGVKTIVHGPITFTPDANPLIGPAFGIDKAWLLTGSSMGVMEGGGAGHFLAEWIVGGEPPMDALALDPRRFGAWADRDYRLAKAVESFAHQFAIHYPYEERPAGRPKRTSPIMGDLAAQGAVFGAAYGWERPNWFAGAGVRGDAPLTFRRPGWFAAVAEECRAVAEAVALADLSVFAKFEITGPGAAACLDRLGANRAPAGDGRIGLIHALTPSGGVASEFTVTRLSAERFYLTSAAAAERMDEARLRAAVAGHDGLVLRNVTSERGAIGVMGPLSRVLLAPLCEAGLDNDAFAWLRAREITVAGVPVLALRVSYVGELGWELHHELADQPRLYRALRDAGRGLGLGHYGAFAMNALRLEKGYRAWGLDLTSERTPLEAGLAAFVRPRGRNFPGKAALARETAITMALLEIDCPTADPFGLHPLFAGDRVVGITTSGAYGHRTGRQLALAYLEREALAPDRDLGIEIIGSPGCAKILTQPPYDPDNTRPRTA